MIAAQRRGGRAVECTGLENRHRSNSVVSSNLTLSATSEFDQIAGSDLGRRSAMATARAARGPGWTYPRFRPRSTARPPNRSVSALVAEAGSISGAFTVNKGVTSLADASPVARAPSNPMHNPQNTFDLT